MKSFLNLIASDLLSHFSNDMRDVVVVFPGKRAGMFLSREFALLGDKPVWAPTYCTMSDLFQSLTSVQVADPLECICQLHRTMQEVLGADYTESLDDFWSWGEVLMADFDDIDKHLANAQAIFSNIADQESLSNIDYLDDNQRRTLEDFFKHFSIEKNTRLKEKFLKTWKHMFEIYTRFHNSLLAEGKLWEGALFRHVTEQMQSDESLVQKLLDGKRAIVFAGFNVLNKVEHFIMTAVKRENKARFYWDYDKYYCDIEKNYEAGEFMKKNLSDFPNAISDADEFDNFSHLKDVTFIACSTDNSAARYANNWVEECAKSKADRKAIILCNEALMQPVLHAIPESEKEVNVTMGFPIADTPIYGILMALLRLQLDGYDGERKRFRNPFKLTLRRQPLFSLLNEEDCFKYCGEDTVRLLDYLLNLIRQIALHYAQIEKPNIFEQLHSETIFRLDKMLCLLKDLTQDKDNPLVILPGTLRRVMRQMMMSAKIPFHSEPDKGLQLMGMLETRCLDFEHMLMLSVEEGNLPRNANANSFIPETLRKAFGLTTQQRRIAVYAYYFYRLIQRCEHLTCVYNESNSGDGGQHEMSRFLRQMLAETEIPIKTSWLRCKPMPNPSNLLKIEKTKEVMTLLRQRFDQGFVGGRKQTLSPSAINAYMSCPMQFYLDKVLCIRQEDNQDEEISANIIGNIFHDSAEFFYERLQNRYATNDVTRDMLCDVNGSIKKEIVEELELILHTAFDVSWFHPTEEFDRLPVILERFPKAKEFKVQNPYKGTTLIARDVLLDYLHKLILFDAQHASIHFIANEEDRTIELKVGDMRIKVGGRVDRIDEVDGHLRIVDYKTGSYKKEDKEIKMEHLVSLDEAALKNHKKNYLQTFIYALAEMEEKESDRPIQPILFFPIKVGDPDYDPILKIGKNVVDDFANQYADEFKQGLQNIIADIFNPEKPFTCTTIDSQYGSPCTFCKLQTICGKKSK